MNVTDISWLGLLIDEHQASVCFFSDQLGLALVHRDEGKSISHFRPPSGQLLEVYGPSNRQPKEKYRRFDGPAP